MSFRYGHPFPSSFWVEPITDKTPITGSDNYRDHFLDLVDLGGYAYIGSHTDGHPLYTVSGHQPRVAVAADPLWTPDPGDPLYAAMQAGVPIPDHARPGDIADATMSVWCPDTDEFWEFWAMTGGFGNWAARYGGYTDEASTFNGAFPDAYGGAASGLTYWGGTIRPHELRQGHIPHALYAAVDYPKSGKIAGPATRTDGTSSATYAPVEGMCFTLPDDFDPDSLTYRTGQIVARCVQEYGIYICDATAAPGIMILFAEDPKSVGTDWVYSSSYGFFEGQSATTIMADFPFEELMVLDTTISNYP